MMARLRSWWRRNIIDWDPYDEATNRSRANCALRNQHSWKYRPWSRTHRCLFCEVSA